MELRGEEPGMILEFDDFHQSTIRRQSAQHQSLRGQLLTIGVVELIAMAMPFPDFAYPVHLLGERPVSEHAEVAPQPHGAALIANGMLIRHEMDDRVRRTF